ncbi:hypothetical protein GC194_02905 [bacterium]|nr:hypothetical protein [bacterium]
MTEQKKNSPAYLVLMIAILVLATYVIIKKLIGSPKATPVQTEIEKSEKEADEKDSTAFFSHSEEEIPAEQLDEMPVEKLPKYEDIDETTRKLFERIMGKLDKAYALPENNAQRKKILNAVKNTIDSAKAIEDNPFLSVNEGDMYMLMFAYESAAEAYLDALQRMGKIPNVVHNYANACYNSALARMKNHDTDNAIVYLEKFSKIAPGDTNGSSLLFEWYKKRAVGLLRKQENPKGMELLKKANNIKPDNYVILFNMGIAQYRMLKTDEAIALFKKCIAMKPDKSDYAKNYLFTIYMQKGDRVNAEKYRTEATDITIPIDK